MKNKTVLPLTIKLTKKLASDLEVAAAKLRLPPKLYIRRCLECAVTTADKFVLLDDDE